MQEIEFSVNGQRVSGRLFLPFDSKHQSPAVLIIHGWESRQSRFFKLAEDLSGLGYVSMTFDMRGHGESEGEIKQLSRQDFLNDCLAAYDFLSVRSGTDPSDITVFGSSFGAYLGVILTSKRKVKSLALRVPADYPDEGFNEPKLQTHEKSGFTEWRSQTKEFNATAALRAVHEFSGKILVIESEKDEVVPHQTVASYMNAVTDKNKLTHIVMKDAPHTLSQHPQFMREFQSIFTDWLTSKQ